MINCYRNLTKKCISYFRSGEKVRHCQAIELTDVRFHVREGDAQFPAKGTRQWTLKHSRKCVHAFLKGKDGKIIDLPDVPDVTTAIQVTYNPYKSGYFVRRDNGEPVTTAKKAVVTASGGIYIF